MPDSKGIKRCQYKTRIKPLISQQNIKQFRAHLQLDAREPSVYYQQQIVALDPVNSVRKTRRLLIKSAEFIHMCTIHLHLISET